jgi:RNA-directed DNA polymerase
MVDRWWFVKSFLQGQRSASVAALSAVRCTLLGTPGMGMSHRLQRLAQYLRGWMNDYGISEYYRPVPELDHWIRRRIRMCYWKQWRFARTKVRQLLSLGTGKRQAILTAISRKSYWHLSRTLATQTGMTNKWLESQGLVLVRQLWIKAHGYS